MEFLRLLRSESNRDTTYLLIVAGFSGLLGTLLVALIIASAQKVSPGQLDALDLAKFAFCLVCYIFGRRYILVESSALAERIVMKMRLRILDKIRRANLSRFEQVGTARIYSVLNESAVTLSSSAGYIANGFSSAVMLIFATFYVAYLSLSAFVMTFGVILAGFLLFSNTRKNLDKQLKMSSEKETEFFGLMQHLLDGFKEVKMNRARSDDLYGNYLVSTAGELRGLKLAADRQFAAMSIIGQNFLYVLVAFMIFVLPAFGAADAQKVGQLATAIIFIMGPLGDVVASIPLLMRSSTAIGIIDELESALESTALEGPETDRSRETAPRPFREISLHDVSFAYEHRLGDGAFQLGPLDLSIKSNELLFIVGGNGSGKSTLLKVLTGLYAPETGMILLDGELVHREDLPVYRSLYSIIFTDFHLFDRLYGLQNIDQQIVDDLLVAMRLQQVTRVEAGQFKNTDLSTGQKKRLALIVALLERRPILVFDEVAADQDPGFRRYFYETLLPQLRSEGRTIVAATHDDHYFHVADRVLKMEDGKFVE
jgi:putative pyoverdin transport system ATP-binding/permease protein